MAAGLGLALLAPAPLRGAGLEETDYSIATNVFAGGQYQPAEGMFSSFVATYTNSTFRTNAFLYLARCRIELSNYTGALQLLAQEMPTNKLAPDFVYWMAQARYRKGEYTNAIERCLFLLQNFTADPPLPLRATLLQARALAKLGDWPNVIALLSKTNGVFQSAARAGPGDPEAVDGYFLLGQAYLIQEQDADAEEVLGKIDTNSLTLDLKWQRQNLLCQVLLEEGRLEEALAGSTNLLAFASRSSQDQRIATALLRGEIFERTGQIAEAIQAYSYNLERGFPTEVKREALRKTIDLKLLQNQPANTMPWLEAFIQKSTNEPNLDLARFHLGDLKLKAFFAPPEPGTNSPPAADADLLSSAITNLGRVIQDSTNIDLLGSAYLDRGWCDWARGDFAGASTDFSAAALRLPWSKQQAAALLKLGDACFRQSNYPAAVIHYNQLIQDYATMADVTNELFDLALYQLVQANLKLGHEAAAREAAERILAWFPISGYGVQSGLLLGEDASNRKTNYPAARAAFQQLLEKYPGTPLWAEIQLAIARTYEQEGDWTNAVNLYASLEGSPNFATNAHRSQVEFSLALASGKAGQESNALIRMSNVVSQFPGDFNAALAQNWIGNYHMNHGNYVEADYAFQELYDLKKFPKPGDLAWRARVMAGLAAFKHLDLAGASNDFYSVVIDTNAPAGFLAQAQFQLGYTVFQQFLLYRTNETVLNEAIKFLSTVTNSSPTNFLATLAFGQLGNCYLEWADLSKSNSFFYTKAILMYQAVLQDTNDSPADVTARSQAQFGLGLVAERQKQPEEALRHYCAVLYDLDTKQADPVWVKEAGVKAAALYEEQKHWSDAETVYRRVQDVVPSLRSEMQRNIDRVKAAATAN
jgi:TolA-binding protein